MVLCRHHVCVHGKTGWALKKRKQKEKEETLCIFYRIPCRHRNRMAICGSIRVAGWTSELPYHMAEKSFWRTESIVVLLIARYPLPDFLPAPTLGFKPGTLVVFTARDIRYISKRASNIPHRA
jgi:hypothetical protein